MNRWLISDTHFGHANIVKYCNRPENHNELMIENWQKLVQPEDTILHLGDVFMGKGSKEYVKKIFPDLPGYKMLIRGNHDTASDEFYKSLGFELFSIPQLMGKKKPYRVTLTHYPLCGDYASWDINIHGHIHNQGYAPGTPMRDYRNISVEVTDYAPVLVDDAIYGNAYESRADAPAWELSRVVDLKRRGKLDERFCEITKV